MSFSASGGRWLDGTSISYQRGPTGVISTRRGSSSEYVAPRRPARARSAPRAGLGEPLGQALAPLDDGDRVVERGVEVEVVELGDAAEPVGVDVHQRRAVAQRRVHPGDHERRRRDVAAHAEAGAEPLGERRLAGAELAGEHHQVAGAAGWPASAAPSARIASASGASNDVGGSGRRSSTYGGVPPDRDEAVLLARSRTVAGQLLAGRRTVEVVVPVGRARRPRRPGRVATPWPARRGQHAEAAQPERVAVGVEDQRADVAPVVDDGEQAAVPASAAAIDSSVSPSASAGGSSGGRAAKAARTTASTAGGRLGADPADVDASPSVDLARPRGASSWSSSALTCVVPLQDHHVAGALALEQRRAGDAARAACGCGRSRSACPRCRR